MARPKGTSSTKKEGSEKDLNVYSCPKVLSALEREFGDGIVTNGQELSENPPEIISLSPALDVALGGGLQVGSLVTIAGPARCGKTTTALHFAAKWQSLGRKVVYLDAEHRLRNRDIKGIPGLKPDEFTVIRSTRGNILTAQSFLSMAEKILSESTNLLLIIDSISILSEERERVGGIGTETRGGSGRIVGQFCRLTTPTIPVNSHIVIAMAHLYSNTSGYGKKYFVSMGSKADYALSTSLYSTKTEEWHVGSNEDKNQIGQINHWKVERSSLGPPGNVAESYLRYGFGIDELQETLKFAEDLKLYEVGGSWYAYPNSDEPMVRAQGMEKFKQGMMDNPEALNDLRQRIRELLE